MVETRRQALWADVKHSLELINKSVDQANNKIFIYYPRQQESRGWGFHRRSCVCLFIRTISPQEALLLQRDCATRYVNEIFSTAAQLYKNTFESLAVGNDLKGDSKSSELPLFDPIGCIQLPISGLSNSDSIWHHYHTCSVHDWLTVRSSSFP